VGRLFPVRRTTHHFFVGSKALFGITDDMSLYDTHVL